MTFPTVPLFPLKLFLLPGDYTQLYIFEERYKALVTACREEGKPFGIPFFEHSNAGKYGSLVEIAEVVKTYHGGEMDIIVKCVGVFTLKTFQAETEQYMYPSGEITMLQSIQNFKASRDLLKTFMQHMDKHERLYSDLLNKDEVSAFEIANELYLSNLQKIELLSCSDREEVNAYLKNYMHYLHLLEEQEKSVYQNIYLN
jgi:Lon protease-like protein